MTRYSIDDYTKVIFDNTYILPDNINVIIRELTKALDLTVTTSTPIQKPSYKEKGRDRDRDRDQRANESWETLRTFKSTVIEKKEGIDKTIADIRSCLNKMSAKNYEKNKELIIQYIETNEENIKPIAHAIFDIASTNKFFSEVYADLYKELFFRFSTFKDILDEFVSKYVENMNDIHYVAPNENYDDFSAYNKKNDARKATTTFITNLVKKEVLDNSILVSITGQIVNILYDSMEQPNKTYELDEIMENFYILITECIQILVKQAEWPGIIQSIRQISELKSKEKASLSTRAIFKCMDILDLIKKLGV